MGSFAALLAAAAGGGLDGLAASGDTQAGRHWDTPGVGGNIAPVLSWGLAPVTQLGEIGVGVAMAATRRDTVADLGRGTAMAGMGCLARALFFKLAQHREGTAVAVQGFRVPPFPDDSADPASRLGGRISGYLADGSNVPPDVPHSHYVSTFSSALIPG